MKKDIERRSVLRTAAWSAPVVAAAIATPLAAASEPFDVRVQRENCQLAALGVTPPYFNIYADSGVVPAGSEFNLTVTNGLANLGLFSSNPNSGFEVVDLGVIGGTRTYRITTTQDIVQGSPLKVEYLPSSLASVFAGQNATLTYVGGTGSSNESGTGKNSDSMSVSGVQILWSVIVYSCSA